MAVTSADAPAAAHLERVADATVSDVLTHLSTSADGLSAEEARARIQRFGGNVVGTHRVSALAVLRRQLSNAILGLLAVTAALSYVLGDHTQAVIIGIILAVSVGLGFFNEYRAEKASAALHTAIRHQAVARRDGRFQRVDVSELVPGDVIRLSIGELVPADVRLIEVTGLECNESILTGESSQSEKSTAPCPPGTSLADMHNVAFMGTVVNSGAATGVVFATGAQAQFGRIAVGLGEDQPETAFQTGLRHFSYLLLRVALALTVVIIVINMLLGRPVIDAALFALAIAVGITPQLLPAIVSTSLATGSRKLAEKKVLVKRLVCIEDLGDIDILITDKTGTLTHGQVAFIDAVTASGEHSDPLLRYGLMATDVDPATGGASANELDAALWSGRQPLGGGVARVGFLPFDHTRRASSALIDEGGRRTLVVKGAPEQMLERCEAVAPEAHGTLSALFADGQRVVAVATRAADELQTVTASDETGLALQGFLVFADTPKEEARESLAQLAALGIDVKIATGDNPQVAEKVCADLGLASKGTLTGAELEQIDDADLDKVLHGRTIFARISPTQKERIVASLRRTGRSVGFLGDGVNDALALHSADVGISVDSATDVAKDAADVILLEKDLGVLASGVAEGRRIFANTIKYVLMGTSSNFGTMFSAAAASAVLPFLPMLPSQILLNNLLYDTSQLAIPADRVDADQLQTPSHWDVGSIHRFMLTFGPVSSLFDFLTFGLMLGVLHAGEAEFRTGWFVESLATQILVIYVVRTKKVPFFTSRPGGALVASTAAVLVLGLVLTFSPVGAEFGFTALPWVYFAAMVALTVGYLALVDATKLVFYSEPVQSAAEQLRTRGPAHRLARRVAQFDLPLLAKLPAVRARSAS